MASILARSDRSDPRRCPFAAFHCPLPAQHAARRGAGGDPFNEAARDFVSLVTACGEIPKTPLSGMRGRVE
jgi:hypothetical protein